MINQIKTIQHILEDVENDRELSQSDGFMLLSQSDETIINAIRQTADKLRQKQVGKTVTYIINRNINFTNICEQHCNFCAFRRYAGDDGAFWLNTEQIIKKATDAVKRGATEICMQGGLNPEAKIRGYKAGRFSFNVKGGRCETCVGAGMKLIEMNFLPDVYVKCDKCNGKRYNRETLEVKFKGKSINDVLNMTISEAVVFFKDINYIHDRIKVLEDVGLGYVQVGQSSTTLSGGEAQRIKLASELGKKQTGNTFYILDEPTTGLHHEDINLLMNVIRRLIKQGNSVLIIEHNLDVILESDYIIDLGPEGGSKGGKIVYEGSLDKIIGNPKSHTGKFLALEYNS